jgi:hypothetical protein
MIRDLIRLFVIRYGDTKRDTFFGLPDTPILGYAEKRSYSSVQVSIQ